MSAEQTGAFFALVSVCSGLGSVLSLLLLLAKPVRERLRSGKGSAVCCARICWRHIISIGKKKTSGSMNMRIFSMNTRRIRRCTAIRSSSASPARLPNGRSLHERSF